MSRDSQSPERQSPERQSPERQSPERQSPERQSPERQRARLHRVLVEEADTELRARAHLDLARIALESRRVDLAIRHLKEALLLDARLEQAREALRGLGERSRIGRNGHNLRQQVRAALRRFGVRREARS